MYPRPRRYLSSLLLLSAVAGLAVWLAAWKGHALREAEAASPGPAEPAESVTVATVRRAVTRPTTTAIGTVLALRSVTLRNELPGTVREVRLVPGQVVEPGTVLVALDVEVERAELAALEARAALAETTLARLERLIAEHATSETTVDQARAARDVARAEIARTRAIIERKTVRAPFRARVGLADLHPGQYLDAGTEVTTLQAVTGAVFIDFAVPQAVAAGLRRGRTVEVSAASGEPSRPAAIVAVDARVNPETRNATVRARLDGGPSTLPPPGASVQVVVPTGPPEPALVIPASALRKGPDGDHVFVVSPGDDQPPRARVRRVEAAMAGDEVFVRAGLEAGERVATSGSFKLRDGALVAVPDGPRASGR
ncbi:MAG: efflux RND transporter periplasmic adaptor subunit [Vicinamibacterales bacterium]